MLSTQKNKRPLGAKTPAPTFPTLTISAPVPQNKPLLPRIGAFPAGRYRSTILSVDYTLTDTNDIAYVDIVHKLIAGTGTEYNVNFRFYHPHDTSKLLTVFADYGLTGALEGIVGLTEDVNIAPKTNSGYLAITHRSMIDPPTAVSAAHTTTAKTLLDEEDDEDFDDIDLLEEDE